MELETFKATLAADAAPEGLPSALKALWHVAKGDWDNAHQIAQSDEGADAAWVHAYLHRLEGDLSNANYWYGRAGRVAGEATLQAEWNDIAAALLNGRSAA
ncbi:MAG: hypothetical protein AB7G39_01805 [Alphaproteobacteria bacterium]